MRMNHKSPVMVPKDGAPIKIKADGTLAVPDNPIIPYIAGDGIGVDITPTMQKVVNAALEKAYQGRRSIAWMEVYAGEKALLKYGANQWLPDETLDFLKEYRVAIKGPLTTPVGGGIRSINVALRQQLDLYVCLRPIRYFPGTPSPLKEPEQVDMTVFRENSEDIYAGIEWSPNSEPAKKVIRFLQDEMQVNLRFPEYCGIGVKPVSRDGSQRLITKALQYAIDEDKPSVTFVHKGNIMKFTEGAFKEWGYQIAREKFGAQLLDKGPWHVMKNPNNGKEIIIKDVIADAFLQQILLRPNEYSVIATLNLNGDYISDALAAQVGGIGMAPGANLSENIAVFEATHGTAPKYAGQDRVNPGSLILSAEMLLRHIGWQEAAELVLRGIERTIARKIVTYDLERQMTGATLVSCSGFGDAIIKNL